MRIRLRPQRRGAGERRERGPDALVIDLDAALTLLPHDHNFSVGCRDGVCWAWIQPNGAWEPADHEARHDHPGSSGLITAHPAAPPMIGAAILLRIRRLAAAAA